MRPILVRMEEAEREAIYRAVVECVLYPFGSLAAANAKRRRSASHCTLCATLHQPLQRERSAKSSSASASSTPRHTGAAHAANGSSAAVGRLIGNALALATPTLLARNRSHQPLAARSSDSMRSNRSSAIGLSAVGGDELAAACACPPDPSQSDLLDFAQQVRSAPHRSAATLKASPHLTSPLLSHPIISFFPQALR